MATIRSCSGIAIMPLKKAFNLGLILREHHCNNICSAIKGWLFHSRNNLHHPWSCGTSVKSDTVDFTLWDCIIQGVKRPQGTYSETWFIFPSICRFSLFASSPQKKFPKISLKFSDLVKWLTVPKRCYTSTVV